MKIPIETKVQFKVWALAAAKIPMLLFTGIKVQTFTPERVEMKIPLGWRVKNHLGSMYFGALVVGAECTAGVYALNYVHSHGKKVSLAFKGIKAEFLKRAHSDVTFVNTQGLELEKYVEQVLASSERMNYQVHVDALDKNRQLVAKFELTLSLKKI
jgi:acyl-coenzyme A thioesterase PaaI-like protein